MNLIRKEILIYNAHHDLPYRVRWHGTRANFPWPARENYKFFQKSWRFGTPVALTLVFHSSENGLTRDAFYIPHLTRSNTLESHRQVKLEATYNVTMRRRGIVHYGSEYPMLSHTQISDIAVRENYKGIIDIKRLSKIWRGWF